MVASQGTKKMTKRNRKNKHNEKSSTICNDCQKPGHTKENCFHPGGGKEG
jgi:hypothetical protein